MARVGQKIKLEALIGGIPRPDIYWLHNGKPFYPRDIKVSGLRRSSYSVHCNDIKRTVLGNVMLHLVQGSFSLHQNLLQQSP